MIGLMNKGLWLAFSAVGPGLLVGDEYVDVVHGAVCQAVKGHGSWPGSLDFFRVPCIPAEITINPTSTIDFRVVPVTNDKDFAGIPDGLLPLRAVVRLSRRVKDGRTFGEMGKYLWYRLKETPPGRHKSPTSDPQ